jgi:hypothetical protein
MNDFLFNMEAKYSLPIIITLTFSSLIYALIVRRFIDFAPDTPGLETVITRLTSEESLNLLNNIGLEFLTYSGSFFTIIWLYL